MAHPRPANKSREALYGYLIGRPHDAGALPDIVREFEAYKAGAAVATPDVPFQMLTGLPLGVRQWAEIARNASWQTVRMNLNTFARHGVFGEWGLTERIAAQLADPAEIARARVFPYQLMAAYRSVDPGVPAVVREALAGAMEIAVANVPALGGKVYVCPDVSGSMSSPITGVRKGATTAVRCIDVAALISAAVLRRNPGAEVLPFDTGVADLALRAGDGILANAEKLASVGGGGTACSVPLAELNRRGATGSLVVFVSDNESWADPARGRGTAMMTEWEAFRRRNPAAKLVCIDLQPNATTQAAERADVLNVGGFSDAVFDVLAEFAAGRLNGDHWVGVVEAVEI